uniref:Alpha-1,6-glucosidases pullulanase-type C-terminal domain-containing protein n=1 Tax=Brassica campestris TaxID=3711 RepID=A0A3P6D064_BRACM|nr:unnamed protein product [Brassica rapa]
MVQALNHVGLNVVLDVVYNHLHANGPHDKDSVLDKIVPGYYLRRNNDGFIENSTCVNNTASEHYMVDRLIRDDLLNWVVNYKVDGFRFDLMGHIMKDTMVNAKSAIGNLRKETDGVDGSRIYIYGEGWNFGEVANNGRGVNASQFNLTGTGIGSFNDRIRDATLGGSPFGHPLQQGFITGLLLQPNGHDHGSEATQQLMLSTAKDHIQIGMAANLKDYVLTNHEGKEVKGSEILMHDATPVAYASEPTETINYVSAHDNETLFDIISLKTPMEISVDERCRINHLASSMISLSQGIPFFHAGDEILRSKSLDRDSYNSGDWFNRLDFSYNSNNWGVGLPPKGKNEHSWPLIKPRLQDPSFKPQSSHIVATLNSFLDLLRIRYSSPLFRLDTAKAIQDRVRFHNTGPSSVPGAIIMSIEDGHKGITSVSQIDPVYSFIVVIFNARPSEFSFFSPALKDRNLELHPIQVKSGDEIVRKSVYDAFSGGFTVPARTTTVCDEQSGNEMNKGDEESSNYTDVSILSMRGGDGHNSYATNSLLQRRVLSMSKSILVKNTKEMVTNLDFPKCIKVADLGCSSGQNTFLAMSEIVNTINALCQERNQIPPEIDCCLNDLPGNDFNTTFKFISFFNEKLTSNTLCFVSGVPGSFHSRLFPSKSLHFIHSNCSVNYLSKVPEGLEKNKMSVYITSSSPLSEYKAYLNQFQKDFTTFLRMRSEEMVSNGRMVITLLGRNAIDDPLYRDCCHHLTLLSDSLRDLVFEGLVSASKVNSFKVPFYDPNEEEVKEIIRNEGSFMVNNLEPHVFDLGLSNEEYGLQSDKAKAGEKEANCIRAVTEMMLVSHFGDAINIDTLFEKYAHHVSQHASCKKKTSVSLVVSLIRK